MSYLVFLLTFILYLFSLAPSITVGDSGEFCAASAILGLPHSPGYPLFCLLGKILTTLIPWGNIAFRINILTALFGSLTVFILYKTLCVFNEDGFDKRNQLLAFFVAMLFGLSPAFWSSSVQAEVFTLNTFFAVIIFMSVLRNKILLSCFLFGLGLGNHHTLIFISPLIAAGIWKNRVSFPREIPLYVILFVTGISIYMYLPIRSSINPALDWGNPENISNLWRVISRADYGSLSLTIGEKMGRNLALSFQQLERFISGIGVQYTIIGLAAGLIGWFVGISNKYRYAKTLLLLWILAGPCFLLLANLPFTSQSEGILDRFYVMTNLFWVVPLYWGFCRLCSGHKYDRIVIGAVSLLLIFVVSSGFTKINWRHYYLEYDYGRNILRSLAPKSIFFMDGGDDTFYSMAYLCLAENKRPDVELHDRGGLVFKNIYGSDFRRISKKEKEIRRIEIENAYLRLRPVYYSTFNKKILPGIEMYPDGILYRAGRKEKFNSFDSYSLRSVYESKYNDYRSRALVPIYPYFASLKDTNRRFAYLNYAYSRWSEVEWLKSNLQIEMTEEAYVEFNSGKLDKAEIIYKNIILLFPENARSFINLGVIEEKRGDLSAAKALYFKALKIEPKLLDAYYNLFVIYWRESNWGKAVGALRDLLEINPADPRARHYLPIAENNLRDARQ